MHLRLTGAALAVLCLIAAYAVYCVSPWLGGLAAVALAILAFLYGPVCSLRFWGRLALAALVLILAFVQPADARKRHKHHHKHHHAHVVVRAAPAPVAIVSPMIDDRYAHLRAPEATATAQAWKSGHRFSGGLVSAAGQYLGTNPTGWARVWCGKFLRLIVPRDPGPAFDVARNWKHYGAPAHGPVAGAIGVMPHHVGIVLGRCEGGGVLLRSGNHNRRVGDGCYSASRFIAFRA